ncbi:hypothetical protein [Leuconostoc falkenbergense]
MQFPHDIVGWITVGGAVVTILTVVVKVLIVTPLSTQIRELNGNFGTLNSTLDKIRSDFKKLEDRVDGHDVTLTKHDEQIKTLFHKEER